MATRTELKHPKKKRRWLKWLGITVLVIFLLGGGTVYYLWDKLSDTMKSVHQPLDGEEHAALDALFKNNQTVNILLLGVDERDGDRGRTDTIIIASLNPKTETMMMVSIPRDTRVTIPNIGIDKINHAYAYGGVSLAVETVETTLDIPIHYYALVNMEGFKNGIDTIGGITVYNDYPFSQDGIQFDEGSIHLNGNEALSYIRMRKNDPRGDLGRNKRQQEVIKAAMNEAASITNLTRVGDILSILSHHVETNLRMKQLQKLFISYRNTRKNIESLELEGAGQMINGVWYYVVSDAEFNRLSNEIKTHMNEQTK